MPEESAFSFTALGDALVLPRNLCAALDYDFADAVHAATSDPQVSVRSAYPTPPRSYARGIPPGLQLLRLGIKPHDRVRLGVRFAVPDDTIHDGDPIRLRLRSARGRPFAHLPRLDVVPAQISARVIGVINHVVSCNRHAPRAALLMWQDDFVNFQRVGIDAGNLGRPKFHEIRCPFRGHDHAIRIRLWGRRSVQPYFAGLWVHPSDHVGALQRKVEISV